jgi:hypothetical protein
MRSLCISLRSPATLEHLEFKIRFDGRTNNTFYEVLRDADQLDININYAFRYDNDGEDPDDDKVEKAVLDGLPSLRTKGILFVEAVSRN